LDQALDRAEPGLALVDIAGFDGTIWSRCDRLRESGVPFVVISQAGTAGVRETGAEHGAQATLFKPLATAELLGLIRGVLER
jgi:DNA-binding response OmpR family regulator